MSWRILLEPAYFNDDPNDKTGADEIVPLDATDEYLDQVAHKYAWRLPLKVWTPSETDPRLLRLLHIWSEDHLMEETDVRVYVKQGKPSCSN